MTKHIVIALASAGLLSAPLLAQDLDLGDLDIDTPEATDETADDDSTDESATDDAADTEETIEEIDNGDSTDSADTSDTATTPAPAPSTSGTAPGTESQGAETPNTFHFGVVGDKYMLVETTNLSYVDSLSSVTVYIGWNNDRKTTWGTGAELAKNSRSICTFYVPIQAKGASIGGGRISIYGSDADGDKTITATYKVFENTIEVTRPAAPAGTEPAAPAAKPAAPAATTGDTDVADTPDEDPADADTDASDSGDEDTDAGDEDSGDEE